MGGYRYFLRFISHRLTGQMLADVVLRKAVSSGSLDGWGWRELKALPVSWFDQLARILTKVEDLGVWPDGLLDAYIAMIPKTDGDATPSGQRPLSVLPVVYRIWASTRMIQLESWFKSWFPDSVFSAGGGRGTVEAWYISALENEEVLSDAVDSFIFFVADVTKSFDTVDREILDSVLSSLGLPCWFRHAYLEYHAHVRLRFKLAAGLGEPWTRDGGIPQGLSFEHDVYRRLVFALVSLSCLLRLGLNFNYMLIILSVSLETLICSCVLLGSLLIMFDWSVRSLLPVSVSF